MLSGVYQIENTVNGAIYIGSSNNVLRRIKEHISALRKNKHVNKHLQNAWNYYGGQVFSFSCLEQCPSMLCADKEQLFISSISKEKLYNIALDTIAPMRGRTANENQRKAIGDYWRGRQKTAEHCANISKGKRGRTVSAAVKQLLLHYAKNPTPERIKQLKEQNKGNNNPKAKLAECDIRRIDVLLSSGKSRAEIAANYGVHAETIARIARRDLWKHVKKVA